MTLNFLHLNKENYPEGTKGYNEGLFREQNIQKQVQEQGITDFKIWKGIRIPQLPFLGICQGFKQIVRHAKENGLKQCVIAEDDIYFSHPQSWQYYLENMPEDFDVFFGCVYKSIIDKENRINFGLSGMTLFTVHERFYDTFLGLKEMNNIDREFGRFAWKYKYIVCRPFCCSQLGGYSFHQDKDIENYDHLLEGNELYKG